MSRIKNYVRSIVTGYGVTVSNAAYSFCSIPIILSFLSAEEYGLWALLVQICAYFALLDFGMSAAISRYVVDVKDDKTGGKYGGLIKTAILVLFIQGLLIALIGFCIKGVLSRLLEIPIEYEYDFLVLLSCLSCLTGVGMVGRIFSILLIAHQRFDVYNLSDIIKLISSFLFLFLGFVWGMEIYTVFFCALMGWLGGLSVTVIYCFRLKLFPQKGNWGCLRVNQFWDLFFFGKDIFFINSGQTLMMTSQAFIITRVLGLEANAVWAVGIKVFQFCVKGISKLWDFSAPAFNEMFVRKEQSLIKKRFKDVNNLVVTGSIFVAVMLILCNSLFIEIWTNHRVSWGRENDVFLGFWLIIVLVNRCQSGLLISSKEIYWLKYLYFVLSGVYILVGFIVVRFYGILSLIIVSFLVELFLASPYLFSRTSRMLKIKISELLIHSFLRPIVYFLVFGGCAYLITLCAHNLNNLLELFIITSLGILIGLMLGFYLGLSPFLKEEITIKFKRQFYPLIFKK